MDLLSVARIRSSKRAIRAVVEAVIFSALPVLVMGAAAYFYANHAITVAVLQDNAELATSSAERINQFIRERVADLEALSSISTFTDPRVAVTRKDALLRRFLVVYRLYGYIELLSLDGRLIAQTGHVPSKAHDDLREAQSVVAVGQALLKVVADSAGGPKRIQLDTPIFAENGRVIGSARADMSAGEIESLLKARDTSDDEFFVADATGRIFVAEHKSYLSKLISETLPKLSPQIATKKRGALEVEGAGGSSRLLTAYARTGNLEGSGDNHWIVGVTTDAKIAYSSQHTLLVIIVVITLVTASLSSGINLWTTYRATHPLLSDIERRKALERELAKARDLAVEAGQAKADFLANMSHEIRTPLNSIVGFSGLLLEENLTTEQRDYMETIRASSDMLLETINNVLDFSKISAGKMMLERIDFDLRTIAESAFDLVAEAAQRKKIELALWIDEEVPATVRGDPGRLRQVLVNLVSNAVKFTAVGEVVVRIKPGGETARGSEVRFEVADTGVGLSEEAQRRIFQPFYQADSSTTRKFGGSGLGLAIAGHLVELMSGTIGVESEVGKGSKFWFTVEFEKADKSGVHTGPGQLAGIRALVVDDNSTNRQIVRRQLEAWEMEVDSAANGSDALAMMRREAAANPYAIALLDLLMPEMDGLELAGTMRVEPALARIHIVMMSSAGDRREYGARVAVVDDWLTKPIRAAQLFRCLTSLAIGNDRHPAEPAMNLTNGQGDEINRATPPDPAPIVAGGTERGESEHHKGRILVAEDNHINQKVILTQLKRLGYQADGAANGREALTMLRRFAYDAVLMDCQMPEMDGYDATRELRKREAGKSHMVVIAITAFGLSGDREKCIAAGMDDYLAKPVRKDQLEDTLERWLGGKEGAVAVGDAAVEC